MRRLAQILVLLFFVLSEIQTSHAEGEFPQCEHMVKKWASSSLDAEVQEDKHVLREMLYFLHVPRTGGRTYYHCFLKKLYSNYSECPRSYDRLRFDPRKTDCRLLVSHDDYSVLSKLPKEKVSVVTILRDPVDRVFSTYEFSVEVAARFLVHPNLTSAARMSGRVRAKTKSVSTLDIWPWKYLVPWMREDLFARRDARRDRDQSSIDGGDPYNMEDVVIPLHDYINDPISQEIVHNGATFQIAGLTNNSYLAESHEVRHCVQRYPSLGEYVLQVAKKRLDDMLYVGLTENHKDSATLFANVVGTQVISQLTGANYRTDTVVYDISGRSSAVPSSNNNHHLNTNQHGGNDSTAKIVEDTDNDRTEKLIQVYEKCIPSLRQAQSVRRANSYKLIKPANFTKEARHQISDVLLQEIRSLNHLDVELYSYAREIFATQQKRMEHGVPVKLVAENEERLPNTFYVPSSSWEVLSISLSILLLLVFVIFFTNARRRISKIKL